MTSSVNRPTDTKVKEQDVNNKLQLYGIYAAFANGKVPSNKQIDIALNSFLASKALAKPSGKLSSEGRELVNDVREVVELAKQLILSKNEGNLLQDFIWHCEQLNGGSATKPGVALDKNTAKQHGSEALDGLRTLGTLLISNGQFRKLLSDSLTLFRSIAGDAAANAATRIQPSEDKLRQLDAPAADNTWHDVPDFSKDNIKKQVNDRNPLSKKDAEDVLNASKNNAQKHDDPQAGAQEGASAGLSAVQDKASKAIPEDKKQEAREKRDKYKAQTKEYFSNKKIPQERREQTIWRLKKMIVEIQGHEDYTQAIETLLSLGETYAGHGKSLAQQGQQSVNAVHDDDHLKLAERDLKLLIERFANGTSSDDLFDALNQIYRDADQDPELKQWFKDLDSYIRRCLQEQGYILQQQSNDDGNRIYDKGEFLLRERYRTHTDRLVDEVKFLADQFAADPQSKKFGDSLERLFLNLGRDENGKVVFKKHLLKDLSDVILPAVFENIRYVPIPRIEYTDKQFDAVIENLVIEGDNLAPNMLELGSDNYFKWGRKNITSKNSHKVMLSASGIQCDLRDVAYFIHRKQGFPSIKDTGVMDVFLGGEGFSFKVALATADAADKQRFFKVDKIEVKVKHINIKLKKSKYKLLFGIAKPLLLKVMTPIITKVLEQQIKESINKLDALAYSVHQEAEKAKSEIQDDPQNAPNIFNRYYSAGQQQLLKGKKKKDELTKDTKVNVAINQHDSIFKDVALPGGISTKATEYKELAAKGDKWESPVFSIGSASASSNIPRAVDPTRKPHDVTSARLIHPHESSNPKINPGAQQPPVGVSQVGAQPNQFVQSQAGGIPQSQTGGYQQSQGQGYVPAQQQQQQQQSYTPIGQHQAYHQDATSAAQQAFSSHNNGVTNGAFKNGATNGGQTNGKQVIGDPPVSSGNVEYQ